MYINKTQYINYTENHNFIDQVIYGSNKQKVSKDKVTQIMLSFNLFLYIFLEHQHLGEYIYVLIGSRL